MTRRTHAASRLHARFLRLACGISMLAALLPLSRAAAQQQFRFRNNSTDNGMTSNVVRQSIMDRNGCMWFATENGLHRYDGYRFRVYTHRAADSTSISGDNVNALLIDSKNRFWVGTVDAGLNLFQPETGTFRRYRRAKGNEQRLSSDSIHTVYEDRQGRIWVGTFTGGLNLLDPATGACRHYNPFIDHVGLGEQVKRSVTALLEDRNGTFWVGSWNGLNILDRESGRFTFLRNRTNHRIVEAPDAIMSRNISAILEAKDGTIWFATYEGLSAFDPAKKTFRSYHVDPVARGEPTSNAISTILETSDGSLWCGSKFGGGFLLFDPKRAIFTRITRDPLLPASLSDNRVSNIYRDPHGCYWFSTLGGGVDFLDPKAHTFALRTPPSAIHIESTIRAIHRDARNVIWVSYHAGFGNFDLATKSFSLHPMSDRIRSWRSRSTVLALRSDDRGRFWVASGDRNLVLLNVRTPARTPLQEFGMDTWASDIAVDGARRVWFKRFYGEGVFCFNPDRGTITHYLASGEYHFSPTGSLLIDHTGQMWMFGEGALSRYDSTRDALVRVVGTPDRPFPGRVILEDRQSRIWALNETGLYRIRIEAGTRERIVGPERLHHSRAFGAMIEDRRGLLWITSEAGLISYDPDGDVICTYSPADGLPVRDLSDARLLELPDGDLLITTMAGLVEFRQRQRSGNPMLPLVVSSMLASGRSVPVDSLRQVRQPIRIPFDENTIALQYALLDYRTPANTIYRYQLEGASSDWIDAGAGTSVTFMRLPPGEYVFRVRAANGNDGTHGQTELRFQILPAWYRTWWAYTGYLFLIASGLLLIIRVRMQRLRLGHELELQSVHARQLEELDAMKSTFFANISHEFRTPLSLILAPVEQLLEHITDAASRKKLHLAQRSASRLLHLINQLLDLSAIDARKFRLHAAPGDLASHVRGLVEIFQSAAERKGIALSFESVSVVQEVPFDKEAVEKILGNLLTNALKYTPEKGSIGVSIRDEIPAGDAQHGVVVIAVRDTGPGIPEEHRALIFQRFYRIDNEQSQKKIGTGIGLALVKELALLHHGDVRVLATPEGGSSFELLLPSDPSVYSAEEMQAPTSTDHTYGPHHVDEEVEHASLAQSEADPLKPLLLLVEDNADIRHVLAEQLRGQYQIAQAEDGEQGWDKARELIPDLIISDVMMPKMDGNTLCRNIKQHELTCHIPVILLTARASGGSRLEGYEALADAYLVKPVNFKELAIRSRNMIALRRRMREKFSHGGSVIAPSGKQNVSMDDAFIQRIIALVDQHLAEDCFGVEELSAALAISRTQLHRKLHAITSNSASHFIRSIRLQRGKEMLEARTGNVAEVCYAVGFSSQSHFSRCYKDEFGCTPSEVLKKSG